MSNNYTDYPNAEYKSLSKSQIEVLRTVTLSGMSIAELHKILPHMDARTLWHRVTTLYSKRLLNRYEATPGRRNYVYKRVVWFPSELEETVAKRSKRRIGTKRI